MMTGRVLHCLPHADLRRSDPKLCPKKICAALGGVQGAPGGREVEQLLPANPLFLAGTTLYGCQPHPTRR